MDMGRLGDREEGLSACERSRRTCEGLRQTGSHRVDRRALGEVQGPDPVLRRNLRVWVGGVEATKQEEGGPFEDKDGVLGRFGRERVLEKDGRDHGGVRIWREVGMCDTFGHTDASDRTHQGRRQEWARSTINLLARSRGRDTKPLSTSPTFSPQVFTNNLFHDSSCRTAHCSQ